VQQDVPQVIEPGIGAGQNILPEKYKQGQWAITTQERLHLRKRSCKYLERKSRKLGIGRLRAAQESKVITEKVTTKRRGKTAE
jgi:hypothetical protein